MQSRLDCRDAHLGHTRGEFAVGLGKKKKKVCHLHTQKNYSIIAQSSVGAVG